jgi:hypothetical protein
LGEGARGKSPCLPPPNPLPQPRKGESNKSFFWFIRLICISGEVMAIEPDEKDPTSETAGDKVHRFFRALIGLSPYCSGTLLEIFNSLFVPPIERRRAKWMVKVSEAIAELQDKYDLKIESLAENEHFISMLLHASSIAIKNHQAEKINSLKNILINSASTSNISEDVQFIFLNLINEFTPTHLKIFYNIRTGFCWSPIVSFRNYNVNLEFSRILIREYSELKGQGDFVYQVINDLISRNLLTTFNARIGQRLHNGEFMITGMTEWGAVTQLKPGNFNHLDESKQIHLTIPTLLGADFLNFIFSTEGKDENN